MLTSRRILLIVTGGIAAVKAPDLVRRLRERGADVRCILTKAGAQFVTPMSLAALSGNHVYQDLFSLTDESEMGHIQLSRDADILLVAPATADVIAKMAHGMADDLATTALLATDKPVMIAPSMNVMMWSHPATQTNFETLTSRGVMSVGPGAGDLACGEVGDGRMAEVPDIVAALESHFSRTPEAGCLAGQTALVTSGPTHEPIDPVRYLANRSSGKQGHAIATALAQAGATVTLISGPTSQPDPVGVTTRHVQTAEEMMRAVVSALPVDVAVFAAAVADWRAAKPAGSKLKKTKGAAAELALTENPDILATVSASGKKRPKLVIGFAAETDDVIKNAKVKIKSKGCDWIIANDVADGFGGDTNAVHLIRGGKSQSWPQQTKQAVATRLVTEIATTLKKKK